MPEVVTLTNERGQERHYETVASRLARFRTDKPDWTVNTLIQFIDDTRVVMRVELGWYNQDGRFVLMASAFAEEWRDDGEINRTAALENCETSALGRALAFLGYGHPESIATAEEVVGAQRRGKRIEDKEPGSLVLLQNAAKEGTARLQHVWEQDMSVDDRRACSKYLAGLKRLAKEHDGGDL